MGRLSSFRIGRVMNFLENKLEIVFRSGKELNGWYYINGKKVLRVTIPKGHGGTNLSPRVALRIMNNLKTNREEFGNLYECPMSGRDYEEKIRQMDIV